MNRACDYIVEQILVKEIGDFPYSVQDNGRITYNVCHRKHMVDATFLSHLGLFVVDDFLAPDTCQEMMEIARRTPASRAMVTEGGKIVVDEEVRRTYDLDMGSEAKSRVYSLLHAKRQQLEAHFRMPLTDCIQPAFLAYKTGDFFHRHPDNTQEADLPESIKRRKVSVVVFLNDNNSEDLPGTFAGGELTFYGLLNDPRLEDKGFPVKCKQGLLIAFRSDVQHEVRPVTRGERFSIVTWFY